MAPVTVEHVARTAISRAIAHQCKDYFRETFGMEKIRYC